MNVEEKYIKTFLQNQYHVYHDLLEAMFDELLKNGWTVEADIYCKEKYDYYYCKVSGGNEKFQAIVDKYAEQINSFCSVCERNDRPIYEDDLSPYWIQSTCFDCWKERIEINTIKNISEDGFSFPRINSENQVELINISWLRDVKNFKLLNVNRFLLRDVNLLGLQIELLNDDLIGFGFTDINFYKLLKNTPNHAGDPDDYIFLEKFRSSLKDCPICKKVSIFEKRCLSCGLYKQNILMGGVNSGPLWADDSWKWFNNIDERIHYKRKEFEDNLEKDPVLKYRFENDDSFAQSDRFQ
ncbi:MAG: hypothetical protein WBG46_15890 [Nonlabens sp.]